MSLRGSETTEAISQGIENREIATLPSVARNDRKGIATQSLRGWDVNILEMIFSPQPLFTPLESPVARPV
jgi:hypothetical protein